MTSKTTRSKAFPVELRERAVRLLREQEAEHATRVPKSVRVIGEYAFNNCSGLNEIVLGKKIEKIENLAFNNCFNLKKIVILAKEPPDISYWKIINSWKTRFYVDEKLVDTYKKAPGWHRYKDKILSK